MMSEQTDSLLCKIVLATGASFGLSFELSCRDREQKTASPGKAECLLGVLTIEC